LNVTVPVATPPPGATAPTVAVKVTLCPRTEGFGADASEVLVFAGEMTWVSVGEVAATTLPSPAKEAVRGWAPAARDAGARAAAPAERGADPSGPPPSWKLTLPVGV
jgi:hypothetical protein